MTARVGIKHLMLEQQNTALQSQWEAEQQFTRDVLPGAKAEDAFPDFIARKGRPLTDD